MNIANLYCNRSFNHDNKRGMIELLYDPTE